jgi:CRISPR/Cas system-associated endonuclease Cas1
MERLTNDLVHVVMTEVVDIIFLSTSVHATIEFVHLLSSFIHDLNYCIVDVLPLFRFVAGGRPLQCILYTNFFFVYLGLVIAASVV